MYYDTNEATMMNKCTSSACHFDGHSGAPEQYRWDCPMRHVQGCSRSHWTLPPGNYFLRIAPVVAKAIANKATTKNVPKRLAMLMAAEVRRYNTARIAQ